MTDDLNLVLIEARREADRKSLVAVNADLAELCKPLEPSLLWYASQLWQYKAQLEGKLCASSSW